MAKANPKPYQKASANRRTMAKVKANTGRGAKKPQGKPPAADVGQGTAGETTSSPPPPEGQAPPKVERPRFRLELEAVQHIKGSGIAHVYAGKVQPDGVTTEVYSLPSRLDLWNDLIAYFLASRAMGAPASPKLFSALKKIDEIYWKAPQQDVGPYVNQIRSAVNTRIAALEKALANARNKGADKITISEMEDALEKAKFFHGLSKQEGSSPAAGIVSPEGVVARINAARPGASYRESFEYRLKEKIQEAELVIPRNAFPNSELHVHNAHMVAMSDVMNRFSENSYPGLAREQARNIAAEIADAVALNKPLPQSARNALNKILTEEGWRESYKPRPIDFQLAGLPVPPELQRQPRQAAAKEQAPAQTPQTREEARPTERQAAETPREEEKVAPLIPEEELLEPRPTTTRPAAEEATSPAPTAPPTESLATTAAAGGAGATVPTSPEATGPAGAAPTAAVAEAMSGARPEPTTTGPATSGRPPLAERKITILYGGKRYVLSGKELAHLALRGLGVLPPQPPPVATGGAADGVAAQALAQAAGAPAATRPTGAAAAPTGPTGPTQPPGAAGAPGAQPPAAAAPTGAQPPEAAPPTSPEARGWWQTWGWPLTTHLGAGLVGAGVVELIRALYSRAEDEQKKRFVATPEIPHTLTPIAQPKQEEPKAPEPVFQTEEMRVQPNIYSQPVWPPPQMAWPPSPWMVWPTPMDWARLLYGAFGNQR